MQIDNFGVTLQDSFTSFENYFRSLLEKNYTSSSLQKLKQYSLDLKQSVTDQYNNLNKEIQKKFKVKFKQLVDKCDSVIQGSAPKVSQYQNIINLSNDVFYNDQSYIISK